MSFIDPTRYTDSCRDRTYAIMRKNRWVSGILYTSAIIQFTFGVFIIVHAAVDPSQHFRPTTQMFGFRN